MQANHFLELLPFSGNLYLNQPYCHTNKRDNSRNSPNYIFDPKIKAPFIPNSKPVPRLGHFLTWICGIMTAFSENKRDDNNQSKHHLLESYLFIWKCLDIIIEASLVLNSFVQFSIIQNAKIFTYNLKKNRN